MIPWGILNIPAGRPAGSLGREQSELKRAVLGAFDRLGGERWLFEQAQANPIAFLQVLSKLLPKVVDVDASHSGEVVFRWKGEPIEPAR